MVVTLKEGTPFSFKINRKNSPFYNNVEYFLGSQISSYTGIEKGGIYTIPEIRLNRILLTPLMRDQLRV